MPSILLLAFLVQLAIHLVNTIGASTINSLIWTLYSRLAISDSKTSAEQAALKTQYMKIRKELNATSSQDEFAKWAKLRRQHDKLLEQLEKNKSSTDGTKTKFNTTVSSLRWIATNGVRLFLQFWYSRQAMFWIPKGWVPYYAEWLVSFPRAPLGSVSIQAWVLACGAVILLVSDALIAIIGLATGAGAQQSKEQPMKFPNMKSRASEKKEL